MSQLEPKDKPNIQNQTKIMNDTKTRSKQEAPSSDRWRSILVSDICVQITAWLLLTVGLCIIATTFYVGILHANNNINDNDNDNSNENSNDSDQKGNQQYPFVVTTMRSEPAVTVLLNKTVRSLRLLPANIKHNNGCQENNCKVTCRHSDPMKDVIPVTRALQQNVCPTIEALLIKEQLFPNGVLHNPWINLNRTVFELDLSKSNITDIACSAFNSLPFTNTYQLSLRDLQLERLGGGVLLGLQSLRFLLIDTPLKEIDRAFLQPVQTTLQHLSINSGLVLLPGQTIFGVSRLDKLEYADLSENVFIGPLTRKMFSATPNLRYLHICNSHISAIDIDTFDDFADVLQVLDLSGNLLTTISERTLQPLLMGSSRTLISLSYNRWNCECGLQGFSNIYRTFRKQFIDTIYCYSPFHHYGEPFEEFSLEEDDCVASTTDIQEYNGYSKSDETATMKTRTTSKRENSKFTAETTLTIETTDDTATQTTSIQPKTTLSHTSPTVTTHLSFNNSNGAVLASVSSEYITRSTTEDLDVITLRCLSTPMSDRSREKRSERRIRSIDITIESPPTEVSQEDVTGHTDSNESETEPIKPGNITSSDVSRPLHNQNNGGQPPYTAYMSHYEFQMPTYTFNLTLMSNKSVKVLINDYNKRQPINMIWFSRQSKMASQTTQGSTQYVDYHCESYQPPYLIVTDLNENCTYTFCVLTEQATISPFDCQPMYVPLTQYAADGTWISTEEKQFTIGMLCMIFVLSTFLGGIIGYFGIRQYPELLEGSDNVLVVKSSESEANYLKSMGSIDKASLNRRSTRKLYQSRRETPPLSLPPPPPFSVSNFDLERLSSIKSSATCFEKSFEISPLAHPNDQYELPKPFNSLIYEEHSKSNPYATSPCSPPPLPKRNPSITSTTIVNHFTKEE